jgi:plasmid stabilization system protein ParE
MPPGWHRLQLDETTLHSGKTRPDIAERLHSYPQQSHVIYFRAHGDMPKVIEILRVLQGRMDPASRV